MTMKSSRNYLQQPNHLESLCGQWASRCRLHQWTNTDCKSVYAEIAYFFGMLIKGKFKSHQLKTYDGQKELIVSLNTVLRAYGDWIQEDNVFGWTPYFINIMFDPIKGSAATTLSQMESAIYKSFYGPFCTYCVRNPRSPSSQGLLPKGFLFPDLPVWKHKKVSSRTTNMNRGLHYNGILLIYWWSRIGLRVEDHFREKQSRYTRKGIARIHVQQIADSPARVADYAVKTVKRGLLDYDNAVILPRSASEMEPSPTFVAGRERRLKDIQSAMNVSPETAAHLLGLVGTGGDSASGR